MSTSVTGSTSSSADKYATVHDIPLPEKRSTLKAALMELINEDEIFDELFEALPDFPDRMDMKNECVDAAAQAINEYVSGMECWHDPVEEEEVLTLVDNIKQVLQAFSSIQHFSCKYSNLCGKLEGCLSDWLDVMNNNKYEYEGRFIYFPDDTPEFTSAYFPENREDEDEEEEEEEEEEDDNSTSPAAEVPPPADEVIVVHGSSSEEDEADDVVIVHKRLPYIGNDDEGDDDIPISKLPVKRASPPSKKNSPTSSSSSSSSAAVDDDDDIPISSLARAMKKVARKM